MEAGNETLTRPSAELAQREVSTRSNVPEQLERLDNMLTRLEQGLDAHRERLGSVLTPAEDLRLGDRVAAEQSHSDLTERLTGVADRIESGVEFLAGVTGRVEL